VKPILLVSGLALIAGFALALILGQLILGHPP
jgi:hypothetical protein